jgi:hypothetical protein
MKPLCVQKADLFNVKLVVHIVKEKQSRYRTGEALRVSGG